MTSPKEWDPSVLDLELEAEENWFDHVDAVEQDPVHNTFDRFGRHHCRHKAGHIAGNHDAPLLLLQADHVQDCNELCSGFDIGTLSSLLTPSRQARMHDQVTGKSTIAGSRLQDSSACHSKFVPTGQLHMATSVKDFAFLIAPVIAVLSDDDPTDQAPWISTLADDDPFLGFLNISFQDPDHCSIVLLSKFLLIGCLPTLLSPEVVNIESKGSDRICTMLTVVGISFTLIAPHLFAEKLDEKHALVFSTI